MTKFIFGGQEVEVPVLCLEAVRIAARLLPTVAGSSDTDGVFDAFIQILACQLEDEADPAKSVWTYRHLNRTIRGAEEMSGLVTGVWRLLADSGFVKKGEQMPGSQRDSLEPGKPSTSTGSSTGSSSQSQETGSKAEAGAE